MKKLNILDFNKNRTPFWWSVFYLLIESILPGILIWIFISKDFKLDFYDNLPNPFFGYVFLIVFCYFIFSFLITVLFWKCKFHKSDNFTFSITSTVIFSALTLLSFAFDNVFLYIFVKFVICLVIMIVFTFLGTIITALFRNFENKNNEFLNELLLKQDELLTNKEKIIVNKIKKKNSILMENKRIKEEKFKILQEKIKDHEKKILNKIEINRDKLNKKEIKKLNKKNEKDTKF